MAMSSLRPNRGGLLLGQGLGSDSRELFDAGTDLEPRPIRLMEISSTENKPARIAMNPRFAETFGVFFDHGYRVFTANSAAYEITLAIVQEVVVGRRKFGTHNYVFRYPFFLFVLHPVL